MRSALLLVLVVLVPTSFDLRVSDNFSLPKFTVVLIGALAICAVWFVEAVRNESRPPWRNGLHWLVVALLVWTAITTATSVSPRMSILGAMGSNDGLLTTAAFAVVFFAMAQDVRLDHAKAVLAALYFGAGGLIVLYGLIQLHDRVLGGPPWDWFRYIGGAETTSFAGGGLFATYGNPNHLAGFLAVLVPIGVALFMLHSSRRWRVLILTILAAICLELLQTASRGAMLASVAGLASTGALLWPDVRRRMRISPRGIGALAGLALVVTLTFVAVPQSNIKLATILDAGETLSTRLDIWEAGVAMGNERPLLGHGPDTWTNHALKYRDSDAVNRYGPTVFANGPHNLLVGQLAATGYPGLLLLLVLLGFTVARTLGTWTRLRQIEGAGGADGASRARATRLLLAAVVGGLVAYLVQASFDVSEIGLTFLFWVLLGLVSGLSLAAGVPINLRIRALIRRPEAPAGLMAGVALHAPPGRARQERRDEGPDLATVAIAVLVCAGLVLSVSIATRPYRADHNRWAASVSIERARGAPPDKAGRLYQLAATQRARAIDLNPWEPTYLITVADAFFNNALSLPDRSSDQKMGLQRARDYYARAIALRPHTFPYLKQYAEVLLKIYEIDSSDVEARAGAIRALLRAVEADPFSTEARERLRLLVAN